jgi:hypothetical protein
VLGQHLEVDSRTVHAHVVGGLGDSEVVLWSAARVGSVALRQWPGWNVLGEPEFAERCSDRPTPSARRPPPSDAPDVTARLQIPNVADPEMSLEGGRIPHEDIPLYARRSRPRTPVLRWLTVCSRIVSMSTRESLDRCPGPIPAIRAEGDSVIVPIEVPGPCDRSSPRHPLRHRRHRVGHRHRSRGDGVW